MPSNPNLWCQCVERLWQVDRETAKTIGMASILANKPSYLRAEIGEDIKLPFARSQLALVYLLHRDIPGCFRVRLSLGDMSVRPTAPTKY